jgi:MYXO-CTERM domain-containing protein
MRKKSDDGCGCSTVGATKRPSGVVASALLGLFGFAVRRRRRAPGCPRCS